VIKGNKDLYSLAGLVALQTPEAKADRTTPWEKTTVVGRPIPRVDAYERVSGSAEYPSDVSLPKMLYGAILRCPHPHARVKSVDTSQAEKLPGVHLVASGATRGFDIRWYYSEDSFTKIFDPLCLFEGDEVAAVAAETPYQASDALRAIQVEYEVLPAVSDEQKALDPRAPKLREKGNQVGEVEKYSRGDVEKGFAEADVVLEETYSTACELHTPMELHGCLANWEGDSLTIWESTQGVYAVQSGVARTLGMPLSKVRVIGKYMGGGFGSKLEPGKYTIIAALLAKNTGCPVRIFLPREDTYLAVGNRPPAHMKLKAGVKKDGTLTALDFSCVGTAAPALMSGWSVICTPVRTFALR
jgi:CO/xanthine dehydrogenase Mo-binding subunit